jgi:hypothetical protein
MTGSRRWVALAVVSVAQLMVALDTTIMNIAPAEVLPDAGDRTDQRTPPTPSPGGDARMTRSPSLRP